MPARMLGFLLISLTLGCTHVSLRDNTVKTTATLADLNYQQVLNNLAVFVANPAVLPSFALVNAGTVSVQDQLGGDATSIYAPTLEPFQQVGAGFPILSLFVHPSVQRQLTENWGMAPVTDAGTLRRIRCAYQLLVAGQELNPCDECVRQLTKYYGGKIDDWECLIPHGWFCVGCRKKDVPKDACYQACCGKTYVWVMPEGMEGFSHFTLTVLDLAANKPHPAPKEDAAAVPDKMPPAEVDLQSIERILLNKDLTPGQKQKLLQHHFAPREQLRPEGIPATPR